MIKKPKILIIGPLPPPSGGMATSVYNLLNSHLKDAYDLLILDITGYRTRKKKNYFPIFSYQLFLFFKLFYLLLLKRPAIVHVQVASFLYFYIIAIDIMLSKLLKRKVIFHLRGCRFKDFYKNSPHIGKLFIKFILKTSDRIIALSQIWMQFISAIIEDANKVIIIPNSVDCVKFRQFENKKLKMGFSKDDLMVLFVGSIGQRKGAFDLVQCIPRITSDIRNLKFIFLGREEFRGEKEKLDNLIKAEKLTNVFSLGEVSGQEKIDYYLSSDIFVLPSHAENFPNSLLEAMASGLPVVASDVGAVDEIIRDGENGFLIKPKDIDAIAEKISILSKDNILRSSMGKKNLELVRNNYDLPKVMQEIGSLYKSLLAH